MGDDGKERRSARSAFFFPDSRLLIPALPKFFSLYPPSHVFFPSFGFSTVKEASLEERELTPCDRPEVSHCANWQCEVLLLI